MMVTADVVEKYQILLRHNPHSQVFAPLADAYLERGLDLQAEELLMQGTQRHPLFTSGFVILGKAKLKLGKLEEAELALRKAIQLSSQNILAHQILGDTYLAQKKPFEALKAYKMVLFLNPYSAKAKQAIDRLESASAVEFEEDTFSMAKLSDLKKVGKNISPLPAESETQAQEKNRKRLLQLVDAFLVRSDFNESLNLLLEMQSDYGDHPDIITRLNKVKAKLSSTGSPKPVAALSPTAQTSPRGLAQRILKEKKIRKLYDMLRAVRMHQMSSTP
jgi:tetratricopeptide (TPR) repeat protein